MNRKTTTLSVLLATSLVASVAIATGARHQPFQHCGGGALSHADRVEGQEKRTEALSLDLYVLPTCPVSGKKLGSMGEPVVKIYEGREVRFCCQMCVAPFEKERERFTREIDAAVIADQLPLYPIDSCVVSEEKLGSMGEPVDHVHGNRLVRFCCSGCLRGFRADPAKHFAILDRAVVEKQQRNYGPGNTCVVSKKALDVSGGPVDRVVAGRLVRFCTTECVKDFQKAPAGYLATLTKSEAPAKKGEAHRHGDDSSEGHCGRSR